MLWRKVFRRYIINKIEIADSQLSISDFLNLSALEAFEIFENKLLKVSPKIEKISSPN
ncbi:MAG: hypothetical protein HC830_03905 [Bacteroidetes bacterium]|nr:hypothetical protein [Bacteroidota bacterium]